MERYKNLSGISGVFEYGIEQDAIVVRFTDGSQYKYNYASAGESNIEHMKILAIKGLGLNSFINTYVKYKYAYKM